MSSSRLLARLLTIAAGGAGCASAPPTATEATSTVPVSSVALASATASATASAPVGPAGAASGWAVASAAPVAPAESSRGVLGTLNVTPVDPDEPEDRTGRQAPAAGGTALCRDGLVGVPGSWCSHLIPGQPRGFFGKPHESCRATPAGRFACPAVSSLMRPSGSLVCVPRVGACAAADSPQARAQIDARFKTDGCPVFQPSAAPDVVRNGAGKDECCYRGDFGLCMGRPLRVAGVMRLAARRAGSWG